MIPTLIFAFVIGFGHSQEFSAGVAKRNITPNNSQQLKGYAARLSTGVHDSIYHRIVVMDDGVKQFILVSSDICSISPSEYDRVKQMVINKFNVKGIQFWWSVTHTHSAPEVGPPGLSKVFLGNRFKHQFDTAYTSFVSNELLAGINDAMSKLKPARLGVSWGYSNANINRRARNIEGKTRLGMNPDGPVDRRIGIISIVDKISGEQIANIANYAIHGTVLGANTLISGDAPGIVSEYVEKMSGAPLLFINGAAGNIAPIYSGYPSPAAGHLEEFKVLLGDKILDALNNVEFQQSIEIELSLLKIRTPRKAGLDWAEDLAAYSVLDESGEPQILLPINFLKLNDRIAIWSAPLELFCEISSEIRGNSPFPFTFNFGYTNGSLGYMVTEAEIKLGGYEPQVSPFSEKADSQLIETVSAYLQEEISNK